MKNRCLVGCRRIDAHRRRPFLPAHFEDSPNVPGWRIVELSFPKAWRDSPPCESFACRWGFVRRPGEQCWLWWRVRGVGRLQPTPHPRRRRPRLHSPVDSKGENGVASVKNKIDKCSNKWINKLVNEWMKKLVNKQISQRMKEWMNEWMNEWMKEWMNVLKNEWMMS